MSDDNLPGSGHSLLDQVEGAEKLFLTGRRSREADLESAVKFFLATRTHDFRERHDHTHEARPGRIRHFRPLTEEELDDLDDRDRDDRD